MHCGFSKNPKVMLNNTNLCQGLKCEFCDQNYHKKCIIKIPNNCSHLQEAAAAALPKSPSDSTSTSSSTSGDRGQGQTELPVLLILNCCQVGLLGLKIT